MTIERRAFLRGGLSSLALISNRNLLDGLSDNGEQFYAPGPLYSFDFLKWLYIGWENDHPKSWTFMGGAVAPGLRDTIQFAVSVEGRTYYPDELSPSRKQNIKWYLREGFLPVPVSEWDAGPVHVTIQHLADRVLQDTVTALYSRVELYSSSPVEIRVGLAIGGAKELPLPLTGEPTHAKKFRMSYESVIQPGRKVVHDFVSLASGSATPSQLAAAGGFDAHYDSMKTYWLGRLKPLTHPVALPNSELVNMYKALQIVIWENMVKVGNEHEIHAAPRAPAGLFDYDRTFTHDVPNYADQFMREGDCELAKKIIDSRYYKELNRVEFGAVNYLDTIGKYMLPFAEYLRVTGDLAYFTPERRQNLKTAARNIHAARVFDDPRHYGLMKKSQDFENWADDGDFLLCDNWGALHGLQAYKNICIALGDTQESKWAEMEMSDLNQCLNNAISRFCEGNKSDYYFGSFDKISALRYQDVNYSWVPYSGALSTFPWGAYLKGFELGGAWKEKLDASLEYALRQRDEKRIPEGSWGTWWGHPSFGSCYNASAGLQCLLSDKYRTEAIKNVEFLAEHQCSPFQWSEAFEFKGADQWVGMYTPPVDYGNSESWGYSFIKQALLQACISVKSDGTVILGRGVPRHWIYPGSVIEWANVCVNRNKKICFRISAAEHSLELAIWGDIPGGEIILDLPILVNNIQSASSGRIDEARGCVVLPADIRKVTVILRSAVQAPAPH
jgi:hypothetical protein